MSYEIHIPIFEGPLDLLLHLVKKNDLEIKDITISQITGEFLEYINLMKDLNLDIAGEFLVMASTLLEMKSRSMLPGEEEREEAEEFISDLKSRLEEYQKYKQVAQVLSQREDSNRGIFYRNKPEFSTDDYTLEVSLFDLLDTFKNVITLLPEDVKKIVYEEIPIERKIAEILEVLKEKKFISFIDFLRREKTRMGIVVSFMAILELIRLGQIIARQKERFGEIRLYLIEYKPEEEIKEELSGGTSDDNITNQ